MKPGRIFFAALGLITETTRRAEETFEELAERGRLRRRDPRAALKRLVGALAGEHREAGKIVKEIARDAFESTGLATERDLAQLADRVSALEKKLKGMKQKSSKTRNTRKHTGRL